MPLFNCNAVVEAANADSEFRLAARFWNADLRLAADDEAYLMRSRDGLITGFTQIGDAEAAKAATDTPSGSSSSSGFSGRPVVFSTVRARKSISMTPSA